MVSAQGRQEDDRSRVVSRAVVKAAGQLGLSDYLLGRVIGASDGTVARLKAGTYMLRKGTRSYDLAVLLLRLDKELSAILTDEDARRSWMCSPNLALGNRPIEMILTASGLMRTIAYLDSRVTRP